MNKKSNFIIPACAALAFLYLIFAAKPLLKELQFIPEWTIDIENAEKISEETENTDKKTIHFKLGQTIGYISESGKVINRITFPYKASICSSSYILYGTASENMDFYSPEGTKAGTVVQTGFPYFTETGKFLFAPGGSAFTMLNADGSKKWSYEGSTPVTAFSSSENAVAAGYADGTILSFDTDGNLVQSYKPGGSTWEVILGAAVSSSGRYVATVSGQDNQRFVISEKVSKNAGSNASIIFYKTLKDELNSQVLIKFNKAEENVYFSCGSGLGIVNIKTLRDSMIPVKGRILSIQESHDGKEVFVLSKTSEQYIVSVIEGFDVLAGSFAFSADNACIAVSDSSLFVGRNSKISKINIIHK